MPTPTPELSTHSHLTGIWQQLMDQKLVFDFGEKVHFLCTQQTVPAQSRKNQRKKSTECPYDWQSKNPTEISLF
jgi:hypothetical protein